MSKAVLVMDMPSGCIKCPLYDYVTSSCFLTNKFPNNISDDFKPDWCPLKPMPEKKVLSGDVADIQKMGKELIDIGYNACIDELLKREEG